ncbi:5490_t:CDS:2 [Paraglomus brasilianum]|uniref:5490_t:CDS:1 n=1 Tax=Paraglomus brasilianum TaxID=144538 RepID=A0A9N9FWM9_9GLOM|nr:5490_t:CDS:2 [Paraglomus brasilianum]
MAYNNSPNLQNPTDGNPPINPPSEIPTQVVSNFTTDKTTGNTQYVMNDPNSQIIYTVGPDGNPVPNNPVLYTVAEGTPVVPVMPYDNTIVTSVPPSSPPQFKFASKEVYIAIAALILVLVGAIMLGVAKPSLTSCVKNCSPNYSDLTDISSIYSASLNYDSCLKKSFAEQNDITIRQLREDSPPEIANLVKLSTVTAVEDNVQFIAQFDWTTRGIQDDTIPQWFHEYLNCIKLVADANLTVDYQEHHHAWEKFGLPYEYDDAGEKHQFFDDLNCAFSEPATVLRTSC